MYASFGFNELIDILINADLTNIRPLYENILRWEKCYVLIRCYILGVDTDVYLTHVLAARNDL